MTGYRPSGWVADVSSIAPAYLESHFSLLQHTRGRDTNMESYTQLLLRRYNIVKGQHPSEHQLIWELRILDEFWASNPQNVPSPPGLTKPVRPAEWADNPNLLYEKLAGQYTHELGLLVRTDYSNEDAWSTFITKLQEAEDEFIGETSTSPDVNMVDADADADADSDDSSDDDGGFRRPIIKVVNPASEEDRQLLAGISNIHALRLFSDQVDVRPRARPAGMAPAAVHRLVDRNGLQEYYEGVTLWIYDAKSNVDQCARLVYGKSDDLYGTATGDSWRARVSHMIELQSEMAVNGTLISFGGLDRYDYEERKRNLEEAEPRN
ncbi:hypothetical protein C8F01DRAFT_973562 [Mycena amicta]|nr:hypothetical protein C8F01DRAFT_973562 [Mycena amicta]